MGHRGSQDWYQEAVRRGRDTLAQLVARWRPQRQAIQAHEPIWSSPFFMSGGPVHTVKDGGEDIIVTVALPGLEPADITLVLEHNRLLIQGKTKQAQHTEGHDANYAERGTRTRIRAAVLPCAVDLAQASITRHKGLLQITLPKRASVRAGHRSRDYRPHLA